MTSKTVGFIGGGRARADVGFNRRVEILDLPRILASMASTPYQEIRNSLQQLYLDDPQPWLVGFSGGKDSTPIASLAFDQGKKMHR
jgi:3'-phosphoadenosine 5'-phosphosulfate sulfotransferase (PAPS reductase)/FAD synthetase